MYNMIHAYGELPKEVRTFYRIKISAIEKKLYFCALLGPDIAIYALFSDHCTFLLTKIKMSSFRHFKVYEYHVKALLSTHS